MKKIHYAAAFTALCIGLFCYISYTNRNVTKASQNFRLGTVIRMELSGHGKDFIDSELKRADCEIVRLENLFSANIASSDVSRINNSDGRWCEVSRETYDLVKYALDISHKTDGAFDITIGRVVRLWGIGTDTARVPDKAELTEALSVGDYRDVAIKEENDKCFIKIPRGMALDLGAIAKGQAADAVMSMLIKDGVSHILLDFGGNIAVAGGSPAGRAWCVGLQNPQKMRGEYFAKLSLEQGSVVTSGAYERYFEKNGIKYHHIFDTRTGYPAENEISSVSIIDNISAKADALCTALFVMGRVRAERFAKENQLTAVIVYKNGEIFATPQAAKIIEMKK